MKYNNNKNESHQQILLGALTITMLWANSADHKMMYIFFPLEYRIWHFMQIVSLGENLHEASNPIF